MVCPLFLRHSLSTQKEPFWGLKQGASSTLAGSECQDLPNTVQLLKPLSTFQSSTGCSQLIFQVLFSGYVAKRFDKELKGRAYTDFWNYSPSAAFSGAQICKFTALEILTYWLLCPSLNQTPYHVENVSGKMSTAENELHLVYFLSFKNCSQPCYPHCPMAANSCSYSFAQFYSFYKLCIVSFIPLSWQELGVQCTLCACSHTLSR